MDACHAAAHRQPVLPHHSEHLPGHRLVWCHPIGLSQLCMDHCRFLVPVAMIICCDVMSYVFGFFFGRTPLIAISPKKTWEGFIGGAFSTVLFGLAVILLPLALCPVLLAVVLLAASIPLFCVSVGGLHGGQHQLHSAILLPPTVVECSGDCC